MGNGFSNSCEGCNEVCDNRDIASVTLDFGEDGVFEASVIAIYKTNGREYIALEAPLEYPGVEPGEVFLYRFDQQQLGYIDTQEEYEIASDGFDEWQDTHAFDEIVAAEDEE